MNERATFGAGGCNAAIEFEPSVTYTYLFFSPSVSGVSPATLRYKSCSKTYRKGQ